MPERRDWVVARHPDIVQVTKTEDTPFDKFREEKIKVVNDEWGLPLKTIRYPILCRLMLSYVVCSI